MEKITKSDLTDQQRIEMLETQVSLLRFTLNSEIAARMVGDERFRLHLGLPPEEGLKLLGDQAK